MVEGPIRLGVSLGDPAGIGPAIAEHAARVFLGEDMAASVVLVGPQGVADSAAGRVGTRARAATTPAFDGEVGKPSRESGHASLDALEAVIALAKSGDVDAIVTAPISKHALSLAGSVDRGHTEILARSLGVGPVAMAFYSDALKVALTSTHVSLREAIDTLDPARILEVAGLLANGLRRDLHVHNPRLALAAVNPHAGEGGLFGTEERDVLRPLVSQATAAGLELSGPHPADSVFRRAMDGEFDGVVALYHDQALIPMKMLGFGASVNVTLGLSVVRTSPDHGTAYEHVGTKKARPEAMLSALRWAARLARRRASE